MTKLGIYDAFNIIQLMGALKLKEGSLKEFLSHVYQVYAVINCELRDEGRTMLRQRELEFIARKLRFSESSNLSTFHYCLLTSTCLHLMAELSELPSEINIGVLRDGGKIHSHAWLVLQEGAVLDYTDQYQRYTPAGCFTLHELRGL